MRYGLLAVFCCALVAGCTGSGDPVSLQTLEIFAVTQQVPPAGAGQFYNEAIVFGSRGGAALPDRFELTRGVLPAGVTLINDRGVDAGGNPDLLGPLTGHARLIGYPRQEGAFTVTVKAISTGALGDVAAHNDQPDISTTAELTLVVGEGAVNFMTPTAAEGTADPAVPALDDVIDFVNPANAQAFYSFAFEVAGGSGNNVLSVYMPRELELAVFDQNVVDKIETLETDTNEILTSGDKFEPDFSDGGWFSLQAGNAKVQVGGFQAPRGEVGKITNLDPDWFQRTPGSGGPALNSRRTSTQDVPNGDDSLGTVAKINFSDYFDIRYEGTHPGFTAPAGHPDLTRRKYPFTSAEYHNAFFLPYTEGVDVTPLRFRIIAEAIDTRGTLNTKLDDVISRKAYHVQVKIPDIKLDTVVLPAGTAGIDYVNVVAASGGVPPLTYDIENVDSVLDFEVTLGDDLTQAILGIEIDPATGVTFGVPAVSGVVEISARVYAAVMNPSQDKNAPYVSTEPGFGNGLHPKTNLPGSHRTYQVTLGTPSAPVLANTTLHSGIDGSPYPTDRLSGIGGVPTLIPSPVGFVGTYPAAQVTRAYAYDASYIRDASWGPDAGTTDPDRKLPRDLILDGSATSPTNGQISGTTLDRGFHPVSIEQIDFYYGDAANPSLTSRQSAYTQTSISVGPDSAVYMRGVPKAQGGEPTGLLEASKQMGEARMVPLMLAAGVLKTGATGQPELISAVPSQIDILPVMIPNGGSDAHVEKNIPSVSGYWPAEADKNDRWEYYSYGNTEPYYGWKHLQQEQTWIQTNTPEQYRVFLWAETKVKTYAGPYGSSYGSSYINPLEYQVVDRAANKKRGVAVLDPLKGEVWFPAILTNSNSAHGAQFGAEDVVGDGSNGWSDSTYSDTYAYYWCYVYGGSYNKYYSYMFYGNYSGREARLSGGGTFIKAYALQPYESSHGRTSSSVAVSADGRWSATALPGGNGPKVLLWRNDKQPIPAAFSGNATMLNGVDTDGSALTDSACIIDVSAYGSDQRYLLPDTLCFVRGGLLFLMEKRLHYINGISLADGSLSTRSVNSRTALSAAQGTGQSATSDTGMPVPDSDFKLGMKRVMASSVQFSFTGNQPGDGEAGPSKVAFIAGNLFEVMSPMDAYSVVNKQGNAPYYSLSADAVRKGIGQAVTGTKAVLFLEIPAGQEAPASSYGPGGSGLNLASGAVIKDLSGHENYIKGDFLTPGRLGEQLDFVAVSPDGKYVAAARNVGYSGVPQSGPGQVYSYYYYGYAPTYGSVSTALSTTTTYYQSTDDILLFSTDNSDLDTASGHQTVLYLGTGGMYTYGNPKAIDAIDYVSCQPYLDAYGRRIAGVQFTPDSRSLIFTYQAHNSYNPKYMGSAYGMCINATSRYTGTYWQATARMSVRFDFRTSNDGPITFASSPDGFLKNMLAGLKISGAIGDTSVPFGDSAGGDQQFWVTFRSHNGKFLYYVSDQTSSDKVLIGFNISGAKVGSHDPWVPFTHSDKIGFEQIDCNAWNYENRFGSVPAGVQYPPSGRDGAGIVFAIGSDASAGSTSSTNLELYAFDADIGGNLIALTSDVTNGDENALNHITVSADANFVAVQRTKTAVNSSGTREMLNGENDLIVVTNVHDALQGGIPNAFILSATASHGATVAFVGEGSSTGPQALLFSSAAKGGNSTWDDRQLWLAPLAEGASKILLDATKSHYAILSGARKTDDNPATGD